MHTREIKWKNGYETGGKKKKKERRGSIVRSK